MKAIKKELGRQLANARLEKNLSLLFVANSVGMAPVQIEHLELGHRASNWKKYEQMLKLYDKRVKLELVDK